MSKKRDIPAAIRCQTVRELIVVLMAMPNIDVQVKTWDWDALTGGKWCSPTVKRDETSGQVLIL